MMPHELPLALDEAQSGAASVALGAQAVVLRGFARDRAPELIAAIDAIGAVSPFRHMVTPGGWEMSVALTNCGQAGWVTDRSGYRYAPIHPATDPPWPAMPAAFSRILPSKQPMRPASMAFVPTHAWSTATRQGRVCRFIRIATSVTLISPS